MTSAPLPRQSRCGRSLSYRIGNGHIDIPTYPTGEDNMSVKHSAAGPVEACDTMRLPDVKLDDKYTKHDGRIYLSGVQALVRLPIMQRQRDAAAGLNTGCFISGYRGSPLGSYDQQLWQAKRFLKRNNIHFQPGVNEDMAATAIWGSQQVNMFKGAKVDGVFSIWYGKGPGVDRSGDVFKHANNAGTSPLEKKKNYANIYI